MKTRRLVLLVVPFLAALPAAAADIVLTPTAGDGVAVTNAAGTVTRFRVAEQGGATLDGNLALGAFNLSPNAGFIMKGSTPFLHSYGTGNLFAGMSAGNLTNSGIANTGVGFEALTALTVAMSNTAVGYKAMWKNTVGTHNTALGDVALAFNTNGIGNVAVGQAAAVNAATGSFNTAVGTNALGTSVNGSNNIAIGYWAGVNLTSGGNNIVIGHEGLAAEADTIRLGTAQSRAFIAGIRATTTGANDAIPVFVDSQGQLGTMSSSRLVKDDIVELGEASEALHRLRPVAFVYREHKATGQPARQFGLIAEEVAEVAPELVARGRDGGIETVKYHLLAPMLLNEVQKQRRLIDELRAELEAIRGSR